jgi:hypothetical protein
MMLSHYEILQTPIILCGKLRIPFRMRVVQIHLCVPSEFQRKGRTMPHIFGKKQSEGKWHAIRNG